MMLHVILSIIAILLLVAYFILNHPQKIIVADAGPTQELTDKEQRKNDILRPYQSIKLQSGTIINSRDYIRVKVDGHCMEPRGINDKSQVLVLPLNNKESFKKQVRQGDVLLIYLHDKKVYKLRILENYDNERQLITYRYENGQKHRSQRNHNPNDVIGVVKYILE